MVACVYVYVVCKYVVMSAVRQSEGEDVGLGFSYRIMLCLGPGKKGEGE